jgi:hypothetical protein
MLVSKIEGSFFTEIFLKNFAIYIFPIKAIYKQDVFVLLNQSC